VAELTVCPIGVLYSPFTERAGTPIQGAFAPDATGTVEVFDEFADGLDDLDGFSHVYLIYVFDHSEAWRSKVRAFRDDTPRGVFATRAPAAPTRSA